MPNVDVQDPVKLERFAQLERESGPYIGYPNVKKHTAPQGDVNALPDPRTYAAVSGFLGTPTEEQGFSVFHPDLKNIRTAGDIGYGAGIAANLLPALGPAVKGTARLAGQALSDAAMGQGYKALQNVVPQPKFAVPPATSKLTHEKLDQLLSKVKPIDELGPSDFPEYIAEPLSHNTTGYHITQDITAPIKEGLLTNRSVGNNNVQGYVPEHVGGAYFWSHPQVARVQRERFYEMDPSFDEHPHEFPVMKFKMNNKEHSFLPDEDSGVNNWRESYKGGAFATKNPISMDNLEAIYTGDVEGTKAQIRSAFPSKVETSNKSTTPNAPTFEENKSAFLAPSKEKGVWYHGTATDIKQFKPELGLEKADASGTPYQAGATFVTQNPDFAHVFAKDAPDYMIQHPERHLTPEQMKQAAEDAKKYFRETYSDMPEHRDSMIKSIEEGKPIGEAQDELTKAYKPYLPSGPNIMPVHVRVTNPFDALIPEHLEALKKVNADLPFDSMHRTSVLEQPEVQKAIKDAGFDAFYTNEAGNRNLGIFSPEQIKSAIGNEGTFDPTNPIITKKDGGSVTVEDPVIIEQKLKLMGLI